MRRNACEPETKPWPKHVPSNPSGWPTFHNGPLRDCTVTLDVGTTRHDVATGVTVATLLPLTNSSAAPGLEVWDPSIWNRRRLADASVLGAVELVTAFGMGGTHARRSRFSLAAMTTAVRRLLIEYEFVSPLG